MDAIGVGQRNHLARVCVVGRSITYTIQGNLRQHEVPLGPATEDIHNFNNHLERSFIVKFYHGNDNWILLYI